MPPLRIFNTTRRVTAVPESAKTPAQSGGPLRFPQTAPKAMPNINEVIDVAKTSSCSREAGKAMTHIKGWVLRYKNLRPLFLVMDHEQAIPGIRKYAGEIILALASDDLEGDEGNPSSYFKRPGDRMSAMIRVRETVPELEVLANSIIKKKYKK